MQDKRTDDNLQIRVTVACAQVRQINRLLKCTTAGYKGFTEYDESLAARISFQSGINENSSSYGVANRKNKSYVVR